MPSIQILGQTITLITTTEIRAFLQQQLNASRQLRLVTVNPEFLVLAHRQPEFAACLQSADLRLADGVGIILAAKLTGQQAQWKQRCTGVDVTLELLSLANERRLRVAIIYNPAGLTGQEAILAWLQQHYPQARCYLSAPTEPAVDSSLIDIVLAALGAPEQEYWLHDHAAHFPRAIMVGVGGTFDMLSGRIPRAPGMIRRFGFEWLWRLVMQPQRRLTRLRRIVRATVVFPWLVATRSSKFEARNSKQ